MKIYPQIYVRFMERFKERSDASQEMLPTPIFARFKERCVREDLVLVSLSNPNPVINLTKIPHKW